MNYLIIIRGPLGIGKTTISKLLVEKLNAKYFSVDKILKKINSMFLMKQLVVFQKVIF